MMTKKEQALRAIEERREMLGQMSDALWDHPQITYQETFAARLFCETLEQEGFTVEKNLAGIATAFSGTYGSGSPVIGFLGEFDALPGMSQAAGCLEPRPVEAGAAGHGCGHNLLGVGSLGAAIGLKQYLEENQCSGTVVFFGCPAEEGGAGKVFMARAGVFDTVDVAFSWHPGEVNSVSADNTMANYQICYKFHGTASHAAMSPELGRSALDALELMNTSVQYLREHIPSEARVHYAVTNTGGASPSIVQPYAEAMYLMRAPKLTQARELYERVNKVAQGAAIMTETEVETEFIKACSNVIINTELNRVMQKNLEEVAPPQFDEADLALARQFQATLKQSSSYFEILRSQITDPEERAFVDRDVDAPIHAIAMPLPRERQGFVSSDVGDVSWNCPVSQINAATMPAGLTMHSWQMVAVGKTPMAKKGMIFAAKVMAGSAVDALENPEIVRRAKEELVLRTDGCRYEAPIPAEIGPRIP